jgi:hypothetical protein
VILPVVALKFAPLPVMVAPIRAAVLVKQAVAVQAPVQKVAASAFNQLVAQIVAESAGPDTGPIPAKPLPKPATIPADQSAELPLPVRTTQAPVIEPPTRTVAPVASRRAAISNPGHAQPPSVSVPVDLNMPVPIAPKLQLPSLEQKPAMSAAVSKPEETAPIALEPKPILELKIRLETPLVVQDETAPVASSPVVGPSVKVDAGKAIAVAPDIGAQENPEARPSTEPSARPVSRTAVNAIVTSVVTNVVSQEAVAIVQQPAQPLVHDPATAPVAALPAPPPAPSPIAREPQTSSAPLRQEPPSDPIKTQQPLRSMALEFTPDGAGDIKVRLSERAGDVHISLHGTDSLLAGRVREGVGDLVGSLSKAGYDTEAWTPGEGREHQRQQPDRRQPARAADPEEFSGILQQPIQEIS